MGVSTDALAVKGRLFLPQGQSSCGGGEHTSHYPAVEGERHRALACVALLGHRADEQWAPVYSGASAHHRVVPRQLSRPTSSPGHATVNGFSFMSHECVELL